MRAETGGHSSARRRRSYAGPTRIDAADLLLEERLEARHQPRFRLPHRLAGRPEPLADRLQGRRLLREQPFVQDRPLALGERDAELRDGRLDLLLELAARDVLLDAGPRRGEDVAARAVLVVPERRVEGDVPGVERLLDVGDVVLRHAEVRGEHLRADLDAARFELRLLLPQVAQELAPRVGRADPDQAHVVEEEFDDVGPHPPGGVRRQAHVEIRVEPLDGGEQPEVALLHQVQQVPRGTPERQRDPRDQHQVGRDQPGEGLAIAGFAVPARECLLLLARQRRVAPDLRHVPAERIGGDQVAARGPRGRGPPVLRLRRLDVAGFVVRNGVFHDLRIQIDGIVGAHPPRVAGGSPRRRRARRSCRRGTYAGRPGCRRGTPRSGDAGRSSGRRIRRARSRRRA